MSEHAPGGVSEGLGELARRPLLLWLVGLALNAVAMPYAGIIHDARLYALQALNRVEDGAFAHDLFFRYGSQDRYSLFSAVVGSLAGWLGIPTAFLLLYLLSRGLFLFGALCLLRRLFGASPWTAAALLVVAIDPIVFGGFNVFRANEPFPTPRLPACGLTLLGLAALVQGRTLVAAGLFVAGGLLHPLMAVVGLPFLVGWLVVRRWPERGLAVLAVLALVGSAVVLGVPALGYGLFGRMDADWSARVAVVSVFHFPLRWQPEDYLRLAFSVAVVVVAAGLLWRTNRPAASFLGLALLVGLGGLGAAAVAGEMGYRVLFQGQSYRALWLVHFLAGPCAVLLLVRAWQAGRERDRVLAVLLVAGLAGSVGSWATLAIPALLLCVCAFRGLGPVPLRPDWPSRSVAAGVLAGLVLFGLYRIADLHAYCHRWPGRYDPLEILFLTASLAGVAAWGMVGFLALRASAPWLAAHPGRVGGAALALFLGVHLGCFAYTLSPWYRDAPARQRDDVDFVASVIGSRQGRGPVPTVYWAGCRMDVLWLDLHACAYFNVEQLAGLLFSREMAAESFRRGRLVGPFEVAYYRQLRGAYPPSWGEYLEAMHGNTLAEPSPAALRTLAADPALDYIVADRDLGPPCQGSNGTVHVYDCRLLRAALSAGARSER